MRPASALHLNQDSHSIEFKLGGIGRRGEPGGREEQRTNGDGRRRVYKRQALRRSLPLKTLSRRDQDSLFCKKVKVSLYTFDFCFVNCCNTSQLMLLIGSRLLKLLVTTKCISARIVVYLFLFNLLLLQQTNSTSSKENFKIRNVPQD